jgi:hypothetical protein
MQKVVPIGQVKANDNNPRFIKDERFKQLVASIQQFPEMLRLRPLVVDEDYVVLGGNMRLRALVELGYAEVPIVVANGLSEEQKREFVIKDNASFGSWDMDALANGWGDLPLDEWGLDLPKDWLEPEDVELPEEELSVPLCVMKITFDGPEQLQKAEIVIQELIDRKFPGAHFVISNAGKLKD